MSLPTGFNALGKEAPASRQQNAYDWLRGLFLDEEEAYTVVGRVTDCLERDRPYEAMEAAQGHVGLTGAYRLLAILLTD